MTVPSRTPEARKVEGRSYYERNRERLLAAQKARYRANKRAAQNGDQLRKYGITLEQKEAMLADQGHRCGICRTDEPGKRGWFTDHCHTSKRVRGILCHRCNSALGLLRDDPAVLLAAADYLSAATEVAA